MESRDEARRGIFTERTDSLEGAIRIGTGIARISAELCPNEAAKSKTPGAGSLSRAVMNGSKISEIGQARGDGGDSGRLEFSSSPFHLTLQDPQGFCTLIALYSRAPSSVRTVLICRAMADISSVLHSGTKKISESQCSSSPKPTQASGEFGKIGGHHSASIPTPTVTVST